jgi:Tol biopolymer transport system component
LSFDGRFVAFSSHASNLVARDKNNTMDVFLRDRQLATTVRISVDTAGSEANWYSFVGGVSGDGNVVVFESAATNLVPNDTNSVSDVFLRDVAAGTTRRMSVDVSGVEGNAWSGSPSVSSDGESVVFSSHASNLVPSDNNNRLDGFLVNLQAGTIKRTSVDSLGAESNGHTACNSVSADGNRCSLDSAATNLVAGDGNAMQDSFVHEMCNTLATWTNYGSGTAGTTGVPSLTSRQFPVLGSSVTIDLQNSCGQPTVGLLIVGFQRAQIPTRFGDVLVLPAVVVPISFSFGSDSFSGVMPSDDAFCGTIIDIQGVEADPGAPVGVSFSQGLELVLGR